MSLDDIVHINITPGNGMATVAREDEYGTVAFSRDYMRTMIGFGTAVADSITGKFLGFKAAVGRYEVAIGSLLPVTSLNLEVWIGFVPVAYAEDVVGVVPYLWERLGKTPIRPSTLDLIVEEMRDWIFSHVTPTSDHRPRSQRWAHAWREIGVNAALQEGRITRDEAWRLMRDYG